MHFYNADGESRHTIIGKNGKERTTSIADARKLGLYPSVTTVMDIQSKPALIEWLQQELLAAAIESPYHPHEYPDVSLWKKQTLTKMRLKSKTAAERGTEIHGFLDEYFKFGSVPTGSIAVPTGINLGTMEMFYNYLPNKVFIEPAIQLIDDTFGLEGWVSERSFTNKHLGFAGCIDLYQPIKNIIIDFKTKDKEGLKGVKQYEDHKIQLAAYQAGLEMPKNTRRFNLFISTNTTTPGQCLLTECTEFDRFNEMFYHLYRVWCLKNKYDPRQNTGE